MILEEHLSLEVKESRKVFKQQTEGEAMSKIHRQEQRGRTKQLVIKMGHILV